MVKMRKERQVVSCPLMFTGFLKSCNNLVLFIKLKTEFKNYEAAIDLLVVNISNYYYTFI